MAASADSACDYLAPGQLHPSFAADDGDIILSSQDGVLFRTHSLVLKLGSAWFRTLFTLPQAASSPSSPTVCAAEPQTIQVAESSQVLADLLGMISGQELPRWTSLDHVAQLLHAAEKYEMQGAQSVLRLALVSPALLERHPVRVYGLACQYGWHDEARLASNKTIGLDILARRVVNSELAQLDAAHLGKLLLMHRRRRDVLRQTLDSAEFYANRLPGMCTHCQAAVSHADWFRFKWNWLSAFENSPQEFASLEALQSQDVRNLLNATCSSPLCRKLLYHDEATIKKLRAVLKEMSVMTVEVCVSGNSRRPLPLTMHPCYTVWKCIGSLSSSCA